ncbi:hypothetical protein [Phocaeicola plebeius]|uniref:hypothetical protein n=1 Tax=Phocaeicola plebeius TaxID=310297 RepID=UPI00320B4465
MKKAFVLMAALAMTSVLSATAENTTDTPTKKTRSEVFITEKGTEWEPQRKRIKISLTAFSFLIFI